MTAPVQILDPAGRPIPKAGIAAVRRMATAYQAASTSHQDLATWVPWGASAQSALTFDRDMIAARVHDIVRNDGWASSAMDRLVDNVVGGGWNLSARPNARSLGLEPEVAAELGDAIEAAWQDYADDPGFHCDAGRRGPAGMVLALAFRHRVLDGEALGVLYWLPRGGASATAMQVIDPDRLSNPYLRLDTEQLRAGVEMDEMSAPIAYHVRSQHPGDDILAYSQRWTWERVPRETEWGRPIVVHAFEPGRAGQVRGVSPLAPILKKLKNLTRYDEAELQAALLNAVLAAFVTSPFDHEMLAETLGDKLTDYQEARLNYYAEQPLRMPGVQIGFSYPGEDVKLTQPQHPNTAFEGFSRVALRNVAAAAGITYEQMTMDWSQVNYSSARAALLEVWRGLTARKDNFAAQFMQPWYAAWLEEQIETGAIALPPGAPPFRRKRAAYCRADWIGPGRGWIDPQKEADAAVTRIDGGLSTLQRECAEQGLDWREVLAQRARELRVARDMGLDPSQALRPTLSRDAATPSEA